MSLFVDKPFRSHGGLDLAFKIDCDALTADDWRAIAALVGPRLDFYRAHGIPRGGLAFAEAMAPYAGRGVATLICDDVLTTGGSMEEARRSFGGVTKGIVLFSRGECPDWIIPVFQMDGRLIA